MITNEFSGKRYGKITLIEEAPQVRYTRYYKCICDCGTERTIRLSQLQSGITVSCGCHRLYVNSSKRTGLDFIVSSTRIHRIWIAMRQRCSNPKNAAYKHYGEKGIVVCKEWDNFKVFYEWSMSNGYNDIMSINRIDSSADYTPSNCEWITIADNSSEMCNRHRLNKTGAFSEKIYAHIKEKNRTNLGSKFILRNESVCLEFRCLIEAAEYIISVRNLTTDPKQIKKNISACLHGKRKTCHGFTFEKI
jgi:hypothetical protein